MKTRSENQVVLGHHKALALLKPDTRPLQFPSTATSLVPQPTSIEM